MPVGGTARLRWVMWGIPALLFLIAFFHRVAPGVIAKELMQTFHATGTIVGLLGSTYFYAYAALMVPAGLFVDAYGVRRVVSTGSAVMGLGTVAMGVAPSQALLFTGRFLVGLGATVTFIGALKVAATWFPASHFGTLSAITATVGVLGSLVATYPLAALVVAVGWRGAFWIIGLITVALAAICLAVVRDRPPGPRDAQATARGVAAVMPGLITVLANPHTWPPFLAFFCAYSATANLMLWVVPYMRDVYGLSTTAAAFYATAAPLALLVSGPLTGYLSDRVLRRRKLPYSTLTAVSAALWLAFVLTAGVLPPWSVFALFFAMGLAGGAFVLTWPIGREVNPPQLEGIAVAVVNLGGFLGAAVSQALLGALLDAGWTGAILDGARVYPVDAYRATFLACALLLVAAFLVTLGMRETRGRNIYHELAR